MQPNLTEEMKINHFHAHLRGLALKTFKNIQRTPATTLEDILVVFRRKYVKPESSASAKHRFNRLTFDPENQKLPDFLEELQESAEKAFGENAPQMIENLLYAKMPPHLKKSINQAYLENGTYDQIVKHLEREMELDISPLCDRNTINIPQSQIGFITYIIEPTFALLSGKF